MSRLSDPIIRFGTVAAVLLLVEPSLSEAQPPARSAHASNNRILIFIVLDEFLLRPRLGPTSPSRNPKLRSAKRPGG